MYAVLFTLLFDILIAITNCESPYSSYGNHFFKIVGSSFVQYIPLLLAWLAGIIFGVVMLRRGGAKPEKLFLAGCSLMFINRFLSPFFIASTQWLTSEYGYKDIAVSVLMQALPYAVLSLAGSVCLVYAFWLQFRKEAKRE